ncbi:hypothetical protein LBMAG53_18130 [Planctomycetota bacterium]|nr:hypothetical protein LBMAG53_18130 [Planctomycetota bacterium]
MSDPSAMTAPVQPARGQTIAKRILAERIAERHGINQGLAQTVIQDFLDGIAEELAAGNRLEFRDFGVFSTARRKPRVALNPKTMEKVTVEARTVVKFKPGMHLRARVRDLAVASDDSDGEGDEP